MKYKIKTYYLSFYGNTMKKDIWKFKSPWNFLTTPFIRLHQHFKWDVPVLKDEEFHIIGMLRFYLGPFLPKSQKLGDQKTTEMKFIVQIMG